MFETLFEVCPHQSQRDAYLTLAKSLKPRLEATRGFKDNIRYKSLTRPGWLLSVSDWEDEKALIRWRTQERHHFTQEKGRNQVFQDYHLRIGEVFHDSADSQARAGHAAADKQMRFDETESGKGKAVTLINAALSGEDSTDGTLDKVLRLFDFDPLRTEPGLVQWDVYEAILTPGSYVLLLSYIDRETASSSRRSSGAREFGRLRQVRVVRDYGMFDREEAPQYYPDVERT